MDRQSQGIESTVGARTATAEALRRCRLRQERCNEDAGIDLKAHEERFRLNQLPLNKNF